MQFFETQLMGGWSFSFLLKKKKKNPTDQPQRQSVQCRVIKSLMKERRSHPVGSTNRRQDASLLLVGTGKLGRWICNVENVLNRSNGVMADGASLSPTGSGRKGQQKQEQERVADLLKSFEVEEARCDRKLPRRLLSRQPITCSGAISVCVTECILTRRI